MTISKAVGYYIAQRRISARQLATRADLPISAVAEALYGRREFTSEEFVRVCDALRVPLDYFYRLSRKMRGQEDYRD